MAGSEPTRTATLAIGFLALTAAIAAAHASPATAYEVSIYAATPTAFWAGIGVALAAALFVSLSSSRRLHRVLGPALGGVATAAVVALPLLRGYRFYGAGDAMTHLGWVRDVGSGAASPLELFYPGLHLVARFVGELTGWTPERSLLLAVFVVSAVVVVFVPLTVRAITGPGDAVVIAAFAALLLLPVNTISTHLHAHPFTQTTLFTALILYLLVRYVRQPTGRESVLALDPTVIGALLAVAGVAAVLYHPQQAANVFVVFAAISLVQFAARQLDPDHAIARHRPMYAQTAFLGIVFVIWAGRFELLRTAATGVVDVVVGLVIGDAPQAASAVQTQGASLAAIGAGLHEIFLKLFLVSAVFSLVAAAFVLAALLGWLDDTRAEENALVVYLGVGVVAVAPLFAVYLLGSISEQYFRHFGFIMLPVTVLGALALARWLQRGIGGRGVRTATLAAAFAVVLALSLVTVFPSPFVYQPTEHVTDQQLAGYDAAFQTHDGETPLLSIRDTTVRYSDGLTGIAGERRYGSTVPDGELRGLAEAVDQPSNVIVSQYDREREVVAYQELRFGERDFEALGTSPGVSRVHSNGEVDVYHVRPASDAPAGRVV